MDPNKKDLDKIGSDDETLAKSPVGLLDVSSNQPLPAAKDLLPGEIVADRYRVLSLIGRGAMGCVYRVEQVALKKHLALKTLNPIAHSDVNVRRFQNEALSASKLEHPNLVRALDYGWIDVQPFLVMDLVEGATLAQHLKKVATLPLENALRVFIPICFALAYSHQEGVIHRDIKPSNIVLTPATDKSSQFVPKLVDFGIAKLETEEGGLTKTGEVFGTPLYMSPAQCNGTKVDNRSDIYSLGCVLYESLTGAPPFRGQTALATMMQHCSENPLPLKQAAMGIDFPPVLEQIIAKMLAKDPAARYQNCLDLAQDLASLEQKRIVNVKSEGQKEKSSSSNSHTVFKLVGGLAAISAVAALFFALPHQNAPVNKPVLSVTETGRSADNTGEEEPKFSQGHHFVQTNFSKVVGRSPNQMRVFDFGNKRVGSLFYINSYFGTADPLSERVCKGIVSVRVNSPVLLQMNLIDVYSDPRILSRFQKDDVQGLRLIYPDYSAIVDIPTQACDDSLAFASHLNSIIFLELHGPISNRGLRNLHIEEMKYLRNLNIPNTDIDGAELASYRKNLQKLVSLDLMAMKNAPLVLKSLQGSKKIQYLAVAQTGLKDSDITSIASLTNLDSLLIAQTAITDKGIAKLTHMAALQRISLSQCPVTIASVKSLSKMPKLNRVQLPSSLKKDEAYIKRILPKCEVLFSD